MTLACSVRALRLAASLVYTAHLAQRRQCVPGEPEKRQGSTLAGDTTCGAAKVGQGEYLRNHLAMLQRLQSSSFALDTHNEAALHLVCSTEAHAEGSIDQVEQHTSVCKERKSLLSMNENGFVSSPIVSGACL